MRRVLFIGVICLTLGRIVAASLNTVETWSNGLVNGWECRLGFDPAASRLSVVAYESTNRALAITFPTGSVGAPAPLRLRFWADTNSSGGRFVGNLAQAGATHLEFDFYGEYTPRSLSGNDLGYVAVELFSINAGGQISAHTAEIPATNGWQHLIVPLQSPPFVRTSGASDFESTMTNIAVLAIHVHRNDSSISPPTEQYRIDNVVLTGQAQQTSQNISFAQIPDQFATNTLTLSATATSGLTVSYEVSGPAVLVGNQLSFTAGGQEVTVIASQAGNENYFPAPPVTNTFLVSKAQANVALGMLHFSYSGQPHQATVTTTPPELALIVTYGGETHAPVNAGSYPVVATINDPIWQGGATGTLVIVASPQIISFDPIPDQIVTNSLTLSATATSGLPVSYEVSGPAVLVDNQLSFSGIGSVSVTAVVEESVNFLPADPVTRSFEVQKATAMIGFEQLLFVFDNQAKAVVPVTVPPEVADLVSISISYDGDPEAPSRVGDYLVEAIVDAADPIWQGQVTAIQSIFIAISDVDPGLADENGIVVRFYSASEHWYTLESTRDLSNSNYWRAVDGPRQGLDAWDEMKHETPPFDWYYRLRIEEATNEDGGEDP
jgi:hypothetical protein